MPSDLVLAEDIEKYLEETKKPMTEEEIGRYLDNECLADFDARIFKWAISIAEKHHGIGGGDEPQLTLQDMCSGDK